MVVMKSVPMVTEKSFALCHNHKLDIYCPGGEIGRRRGLKIPRRKACRFDSGPGHQTVVS